LAPRTDGLIRSQGIAPRASVRETARALAINLIPSRQNGLCRRHATSWFAKRIRPSDPDHIGSGSEGPCGTSSASDAITSASPGTSTRRMAAARGFRIGTVEPSYGWGPRLGSRGKGSPALRYRSALLIDRLGSWRTTERSRSLRSLCGPLLRWDAQGQATRAADCSTSAATLIMLCGSDGSRHWDMPETSPRAATQQSTEQL